jgi:hypothetical protein
MFRYVQKIGGPDFLELTSGGRTMTEQLKRLGLKRCADAAVVALLSRGMLQFVPLSLRCGFPVA